MQKHNILFIKNQFQLLDLTKNSVGIAIFFLSDHAESEFYFPKISISTFGFFEQPLALLLFFVFSTTALIIDKMAQVRVPHSSSKGRGRTSP